MGNGPMQVFTATIASSASGSGTIDFGTKSYRNMSVFHSGVSGQMSIYGSADNVTFKPVLERVNTASVQWAAVVFPSSISGSWATTPMPPLRYLQLIATGTCANGATINVSVDD